jgi:hypothetical protein
MFELIYMNFSYQHVMKFKILVLKVKIKKNCFKTRVLIAKFQLKTEKSRAATQNWF